MRPRNGRRVTQGERETSQNGRLWAMNARGSCLTVRDSRAVRTSEKVVDSMQNPSQQQTRLLERETADLIRRVVSLDNGKMALFDAHLGDKLVALTEQYHAAVEAEIFDQPLSDRL